MKNAKHIVCCNVDVAVIGGGPAGVCAALAVAQNGCKVVLVTDRPVLGGNSSSEIRVWTRGAVGSGNLMAEEMGIWGRLKLENLYRNFDANPVFWDDVLLDAVLQQPNLQLELNTEIDEVKLSGQCIEKVAGTQQGSEKRFEITAKYFIDATGDAVIGQLAGVSQVDDSVSNSTILFQRGGKRLRVDNHHIDAGVGRKVVELVQVGAVVDEEARLFAVILHKMVGGDLKRLFHALTDCNGGNDHNKLTPAVFLVQLEHGFDIDIGFTGSGFHLNVQAAAPHVVYQLRGELDVVLALQRVDVLQKLIIGKRHSLVFITGIAQQIL